MQERAPFQPRQSSGEKERAFPPALLTAIVVVAVSIGFFFWFSSSKSQPGGSQPHLPFGAPEQSYAPNIQFEHIALSRAENFAHQEITSLAAELANHGDRPLKAVEITVEFSDEMPQVVLRESRILFGGPSAPLAPGSRREFDVSFEHIPSSWNMRQPVVRVTGIEFVSDNR